MATPSVNIVYANKEKFAEGDGSTVIFPLKIQSRENFKVARMDGIFIQDWQGIQVQSPNPRTQFATDTTGMSSWDPIYVVPDLTDTIEPDPAGGTNSITLRLGACTGGPNSEVGGIANGSDLFGNVHLAPNTAYVGSMWLRCDEQVVVRLGMDIDDEGQYPFTLDSSWRRYSINHTTRASGTIPHALVLSINRNEGPNAALPDGTLIQVAFAQTEIGINGGATSYIENTNPLDTLTVGPQYSLQSQRVVFTSIAVPPNAAPLLWDGVAYWEDAPGISDAVVSDVMAGVTWRYDQAPNLLSLLNSKQNWYRNNHDNFWNGWMQNVFNLKTANTFGIAVWAFILNVPLSSLSLRDRFRYWAFGPLRDNFTDSPPALENPSSGNFPPVSGSGAITTPREKIQSLRLKYYALTTPGSVTELNAMLKDVFADSGRAYVLDGENMTMTYVFEFQVSAAFQLGMVQYGLLPKTAGVELIIEVNP